MAQDKIKSLKEQINAEEIKNFKIAWDHMNWEHRLIHILGFLAIIYIFYNIGKYFGLY